MRKLLLFLACLPLFAQSVQQRATIRGIAGQGFHGPITIIDGYGTVVFSSTVANLGSPSTYSQWIVQDAANTTTCTTGGGSSVNFCVASGTTGGSWSVLFNIPTSAAGITAASVQNNTYTAYVDTGSASAYAITASPTPTVGSGTAFSVLIATGNTNTGASTLSVNGTSTAVRKKTASGLAPTVAGDIVQGQWYDFRFDGTYWQVSASTSSGGGLGVLPIYGVEVSGITAPAAGTMGVYAGMDGIAHSLDGASRTSSMVADKVCASNNWMYTVTAGALSCSPISSTQLSDALTLLGGMSTVANLPNASLYPNRYWLVLDGVSPTDILTGGGKFLVLIQGNSGGTNWVVQQNAHAVVGLEGVGTAPVIANTTGTVALTSGTNLTGKITSSTSGTVAFTMTLAGVAYTNAWACTFSDLTTPTNSVHITAATGTVLTVAGTTTTSDVILYSGCTGY